MFEIIRFRIFIEKQLNPIMKYTNLAVVLRIFVFLAQAQRIEQQLSVSKLFVLENYQFFNYTGSGISPDMVSNYTTLINNAHSLYGKDTSQSTYYISKQLEALFGYAYSVVILQSNQTIGSFYKLYKWKYNCKLEKGKHVSAKLGIRNLANYSNYFQFDNRLHQLTWKGNWNGSQKENAIRSIIKTSEQTVSGCGCSNEDMFNITDKLQKYDLQQSQLLTFFHFNSQINQID